jgi:hypothetical protein
MQPDVITLTMWQIDRLKILQALADGGLNPGIAASRLGLTSRQTLRLLRRYQAAGAAGLLHGGQGRRSNNQMPPGIESRVRGLIRDIRLSCATALLSFTIDGGSAFGLQYLDAMVGQDAFPPDCAKAGRCAASCLPSDRLSGSLSRCATMRYEPFELPTQLASARAGLSA